MQTNLKVLSLLTASSVETVLNARFEIRQLIGSRKISTNKERLYVYDRIEADIRKSIKMSTSEKSFEELLQKLFFDYLNSRDGFFQTLCRVLVYYYDCDFCSENSVKNALANFYSDLWEYIM